MSQSKLQKALVYAVKHHAGQEREGDNPLPYAVHPVEVLGNLRYVGNVTDQDLLVTSLLHDIVEETQTDLGEIDKKFGHRVASLVRELTRREPTKDEMKDLSKEEIWQMRSDMLLEEIAKMGHEAQTIKLADRLSNLNEAYRTKLGEKLTRYTVQSAQILQTVDRSVNPGLWDAIKQVLDSPPSI